MNSISIRTALVSAALALTLPAAAHAQGEPFVTDSIAGDLTVLHAADSFVVRTEQGDEVVIQIPTDSAQARRETVEDTTAAAGPHTSYMTRDDIVMALEQLAGSDESSEVLVHYITEGQPARRIVVWLAVGSRPSH